MSVKKKTSYAPLSSAATERLEPYRELMGKRPDGEIAKLAGMDRRYVVVFRIHNDIPAYRRGSASKTAPGSGDTKPRRLRKSKLDEFRHLMGEVPDGRIAELASCSREAVMRYRKRYGIEPAPRGRKVAPPAHAADAPVPAPLPDALPAKSDADDLPPELDEVLANERRAPAIVELEPAPLQALEGYVATVRHEGDLDQWMVLGRDMADAARRTVDLVSLRSPAAQVIELRYCADLL